MHLATDVTGVLNNSAKPTDIFTLISELHPSAAVCGTPTDKARKLINDLAQLQSAIAKPVNGLEVVIVQTPNRQRNAEQLKELTHKVSNAVRIGINLA